MEYPKKILFCKFCFLFVLFILSSSAAHAATVDIKNINAVNIKTDSATIRWESDEVVGTSQIDYGTTTSYGFTTTEDQLSYYHETTLTGLNPGTIYHYRIHSKDYDNNATLSGDHTFTTNTQAQLDAAFAADIATRKTQGHVYFVRTDGNDSCNGNQNVSYVSDPTNCAFLTIPKAVTVIASGDSVFVMGGDYTLSGAINISHKSNISFIGKDMPCIRQSNYDAPGFYIPNSDHITIDGFCMRNVARGVYGDSANYLTVRNNDIETIAECYRGDRDGILTLNSSYGLISDNKVVTTGYGIYASDDNTVITHNTVDIPDHQNYCPDGGLALTISTDRGLDCGSSYNPWGATQLCTYKGSSNVQISYNRILGSNRNCLAPNAVNSVDIHHNIIDQCDHNGIDLHGTTNAKVHSNTILDMIQSDSSDILISDTYSSSDWINGGTMTLAKDINIYNNYLYNKQLGSILNWGNPFDVTFYNNIIRDEAPGGIAYVASTNNNYPKFCYGVRFIKNRIISNNTSGVIGFACNSSFPAEPFISGLMDRSNDSNIFMDNDITAPNSTCFDLENIQDTVYFANNNYQCKNGYSYETGFSSSVGNIQEGYYLDIRAVDESNNPISNAQITVEPTVAGYNAYSISGIYDSNGFPVTDNQHLLNTKTSTYTKTDGYSPDATDTAGAILLLNNVFGFPTKITQPVSWKVTITKSGYYPKTFYYSVGLDDYKSDLTDRTNAKVVTLLGDDVNKKILGLGGLVWQGNSVLSNVVEDKVGSSLELDQTVNNPTSWWKFDENQGLGVSDSIGNNQGIFEELGGGASWMSGNYGYGLKLSGTNYVSIHNDDTFNAGNGSTVCMTAWIKPETDWNDSLPHNLILETGGNNISTTRQGWDFVKKSSTDGLSLFLTQGVGNNFFSPYYNNLAWSAGTWHFVAFCFDKDKAKMWKDAGISSLQNTNFTNPITGPYPIWIGSSGDNVTFDDIRLYNRWLTDSDMALIKADTHQSSGTIITSSQSADNGGNWKYVIIKGNIPQNTSVSLKLFSSSDGSTYSSTTLSSNLQTDHTYNISPDYQNKYAYVELDLTTTDPSITPQISNVILSNDDNANYPLVITNGSGSGSYIEGAHITINASTPPSGKVFDKWTGDTANVTNINSSSTTVTMPASSVTLTATYKDMSTLSSPIFSPQGGTYTTTQTITISSSQNATLYYTTNGTDPTSSSTPYTAPITISTTTTLKAIAIKIGYANSSTASATYTINTSSGGGGGSLSGGGGPTSLTPTILKTEIKSITANNVILNLSVTNASSMMLSDNSSFTNSSWVTYTTTPTYIKKDTQSTIYLKFKSTSGTTSQAITLTIPTPTNNANPTFSISSGTYPTSQTVTITASPSATIHYTLDGTTPTLSSPIYTIPLTISTTTTLKAIAIKEGYPTTSVSSSTYTINSNSSSSTYPTGTLLKLSSSPRVYVVIQSKKKWISTPEVFTQLGYQWTSIQTISDTTLKQYPDYEDNLIRQRNDYKVYLVVNGVKRHIPNPPIFLDYGFLWTDVVDTDQSVIDKYKDTYLIKESGKEGIYYVNKDGVRKLIPTTDIFNSYNDKMTDVQIVSKLEMESYLISNLIRLNNSNDVYLIQGNIKKHVPSVRIATKYKLNLNQVMSVNQQEYNFYQNGGELK